MVPHIFNVDCSATGVEYVCEEDCLLEALYLVQQDELHASISFGFENFHQPPVVGMRDV